MGKTSLVQRALLRLQECQIARRSQVALGRLEALWLCGDPFTPAPFCMAQKIVAWLLQLEGGRDPDTFSWFLVRA
eukprot:scaffold649986_cov47-Prasinocladus_malaysianus.AAC.1